MIALPPLPDKRYRDSGDRFWSRVAVSGENDCWQWQGTRNRDGYGTVVYNARRENAQRVAWELVNGEIPPGMCVCHSCDNRACVNPTHLWLGSHKENMEDRNRKGRSVATRGDDSPRAKLTALQVLDIRKRYAAGGVRQHELAKEYGVCRPTIGSIIRRTRWAHLSPEK